MATIKAYIRSPKNEANVYFRLSDGRDILIYHKSDIKVNPHDWDKKKDCIKANLWRDRNEEKEKFNKSIIDRKEIIQSAYNNIENKEGVTSKILELEIDKLLHPENHVQVIEKPKSFFELFEIFIADHKVSQRRKDNFKVVLRVLRRYEIYTNTVKNKTLTLTVDTITGDTLRDIETYLVNEHTLLKKYPEIIKAVPESKQPEERGQNTINNWFTKFKTFYHWAVEGGETSNDPFKNIIINKGDKKVIIKGYKIETCRYGTPYYLTLEERTKLLNHNLSFNPQLEAQRDVFIFQCLIGCRVGDLLELTSSNVIDGFIQYVANKTITEKATTIKVPLSKTAQMIINKYPSNKDGRLLPFISEQKYNEAIKDAFTLAGLKRKVTIINPTTSKPEQQPLNKIASSHLARRTFISLMYKQVSDPNIIGSMTGHVEGSKSFARYREIDDEIKKELVNLLD